MLNLRGFAWDAFYPAPGDSLRSTTPYTQAEAMPLWRTCGESSPLSKDTSRVCAQKARASSDVCQTLVVCERSHREMKGEERLWRQASNLFY